MRIHPSIFGVEYLMAPNVRTIHLNLHDMYASRFDAHLGNLSSGKDSRKASVARASRSSVRAGSLHMPPAVRARGPAAASGQRAPRPTRQRAPRAPLTAFYILARGIALPVWLEPALKSRIPGIKKPEPVRKTVPEVFRSTSPSLPLYHQKTLTCFHIVFFLALVFRFWRTSSVHRCEDSC